MQQTCMVFTKKEGALSRLAHDLCLQVERFTLEREEERVRAVFDAGSLVVVGAMKNGQVDRGLLSAKDHREIEHNIRKDVLKTAHHKEIVFEGLVNAEQRFEGKLTICGKTRPLVVTATKEGEVWKLETSIHQPDFGIKPYSAMMGTLKVQPRVTVCLVFEI